ncbi:MAG: hypothetical protein KAS32_24345 [Candidatus Peribacteraceae bacterium]|nr:hypothetical protein [Candidatus Peribacteraceae bacterium]
MSRVNDLSELAALADRVSKFLKGEKMDALRLECGNGIGIYESTMNMDSKISKSMKKLSKNHITVPEGLLYDAKVYGLFPTLQSIKLKTNTENGITYIDIRPLKEFQMVKLELKFRMKQEFIDGIARTRSSPEDFSDDDDEADIRKFDLSAQLINPDGLKLRYKGGVELEDVPVKATVPINQDVNCKIPRWYKELIQTQTKLTTFRNPHGLKEGHFLLQKQARLLKRIRGESPYTKVQLLAGFLTPSNFDEFLDTDRTYFKYHNCNVGDNFFKALGMISLPESMEAISKTDLSYDQPAVKGKLIYERKKFIKKVEDIII